MRPICRRIKTRCSHSNTVSPTSCPSSLNTSSNRLPTSRDIGTTSVSRSDSGGGFEAAKDKQGFREQNEFGQVVKYQEQHFAAVEDKEGGQAGAIGFCSCACSFAVICGL